jgi:hypothetical protein
MDMNSGVSAGLVTSSAKSVVLSVDSKAITPGGRPSMRLESKKTYDSGLIIGDFAKMPVGCGTWPAFWTLGPNWPSSGEIDIIEGVNSQSVNAMTLHTAAGCSIGNTAGSFTGNIKTANCDVNAPGQGNNVGCGIQAAGASTYGAGFNSAGGGVYAVDWTADHIAVYFFPRGSVPADITTGTPNPSTWGEPQALFKGSCNIPAMFKKHSIVINTTFCGQWAGQASVWSSDPVCGAKAATCNDYVANNPSAFANANWEINSLRVYQATGGAAQSGVPVPSGAPVASGVPIPSSVPAGGSPSVAPDAPSVAPVSVPRPSRTRHTHGAASTFSNKRKQNKRDTPIVSFFHRLDFFSRPLH